jgi:hypothetical protein
MLNEMNERKYINHVFISDGACEKIVSIPLDFDKLIEEEEELITNINNLYKNARMA